MMKHIPLMILTLEDNENSSVYNNKRSMDKDYFDIQKDILNSLDRAESSIDNTRHDETNIYNYDENDDFQENVTNQEEQDIKGKVSSTPSRRVPYMEVVGQVHGTYIIAQNENGMFMMIDMLHKNVLNTNISEKR